MLHMFSLAAPALAADLPNTERAKLIIIEENISGERACTGKFILYVRNPVRKWSIFGVWPAPGAPEYLPKGGGAQPPTF